MYGLDAKKEGAKEYYESTFALYASWGVDFVKVDDICRELPACEEELIMLSNAARSCGREMVLSLSPGPALPEKAELYKQTANMWRITDDFWDKWEQLYDMFERAKIWCIHAGNGCFPDADMLPIGPILQDYDKANRTKFTKDEQITMMTLWSIFRAPLMIGGDMTGFDAFSLSLVNNEDLLYMHAKARHAHPVWQKPVKGIEHILWTAVCEDGGAFVAVFNTGEEDSTIELSLEDAEIFQATTVKDLWTHETMVAGSTLSLSIPKHGAKAFYVK
jgi:hypothetical protein